MLGKDATPYEREAELIAKAMREHLWLKDRGWFAEWKDLLGEQLVHPNAAAWTFYHTIDSRVPTAAEAWQMCRFVDSHIVRIPIRGPNVPPGNFTMPTTSWMPYSWSLNNVALGEVMHTALAYWQAGRADAALPLFKGAILDSMFLGLCPGNVGLTTFYDAYRRETQRDFADGVGAMSRALVEGLFGVQPDLLTGELKIRPGFPTDWNRASIRHPFFDFAFNRQEFQSTYEIISKFGKLLKLNLEIPGSSSEIASLTINGEAAKWRQLDHPSGSWIQIETSTNRQQRVAIQWKASQRSSGSQPLAAIPAPVPAPVAATFDWNRKLPSGTRLDLVDLTPHFNDRVTQIFKNEYLAPRSPFCSLATPKQGIGSWCHPHDSFDVDDSGLRKVAHENGSRIVMPNGVPLATPVRPGEANILFVSQWTNYPKAASISLSGTARHAFLLMAGSTSGMQSRFDNGEVIVAYADGSTARLPLNNPVNWWPIDQDYFIDDFAFRRPEPIPPRVDLKTGAVRLLDPETFKGRGRTVPGGAASVLDLPLDSTRELKSITVRALANEVVIGLMSVTLMR